MIQQLKAFYKNIFYIFPFPVGTHIGIVGFPLYTQTEIEYTRQAVSSLSNYIHSCNRMTQSTKVTQLYGKQMLYTTFSSDFILSSKGRKKIDQLFPSTTNPLINY